MLPPHLSTSHTPLMNSSPSLSSKFCHTVISSNMGLPKRTVPIQPVFECLPAKEEFQKFTKEQPRILVILCSIANILEEQQEVVKRVNYDLLKQEQKLKTALDLRDYENAYKICFVSYMKSKETKYSLAQLYLGSLHSGNPDPYNKFALKHRKAHGADENLIWLFPALDEHPQNVLKLYEAVEYLQKLGDKERLVNYLCSIRQKKHIYELRIKQAELNASQELIDYYQHKIVEQGKDNMLFEEYAKTHLRLQVILNKQEFTFLKELIGRFFHSLTFAEEIMAILDQKHLSLVVNELQHIHPQKQDLRNALDLNLAKLSPSCHSQLLNLPREPFFYQAILSAMISRYLAGEMKKEEMEGMVTLALKEMDKKQPDYNLRLRIVEAYHCLGTSNQYLVEEMNIKSVQHHTLGHLYLAGILSRPCFDDKDQTFLQNFLISEFHNFMEYGGGLQISLKHERFKSLLEAQQYRRMCGTSYARALNHYAMANQFAFVGDLINAQHFYQKACYILQRKPFFMADFRNSHEVLPTVGFFWMFDSLPFAQAKCALALAQLKTEVSLQDLADLRESINHLRAERSYSEFKLRDKDSHQAKNHYKLDQQVLKKQVWAMNVRWHLLKALLTSEIVDLSVLTMQKANIGATLGMFAILKRMKEVYLSKKGKKKKKEEEKKLIKNYEEVLEWGVGRLGEVECRNVRETECVKKAMGRLKI